MSFNDMMESGRGPGVIGMLMALAVLAIFTLLYLFAFDEELMGGGPTIESVIRNQIKEIEDYDTKISDGEKTLMKCSARVVVSNELSALNRRRPLIEDKIATSKKAVITANSNLTELSRSFASYKDQYRAFVRNKAKGEILPQLETQSGGNYKNVSIREVTAVGIQIRHDEGLKRIPFEDLPLAMIDYYQFDTEQKAVAMDMERAASIANEVAANVASDQVNQNKAKQRENEMLIKKDQMTRASVAKSAQIRLIENEIQLLQLERSKAAVAASSARAAGRIHIDQTANFDSRILLKQNQISALQAQIAQVRKNNQP